MTSPKEFLRIPLALLSIAMLLAAAVGPVDAATTYAASFGSHGSARWTYGSSVSVSLKSMTAGTWRQELWSGTCAAPGSRLVTLSSLGIPSSRALARTTAYSGHLATSGGTMLRLIRSSSVVCAAFTKPAPVGSKSLGRGVVLVGMEQSWSAWDIATGPVPDENYPVFDTRLIDYLAGKGVNTVMFLFSWEGMQNVLFGPVPASGTGNYKAYFDNYKRIVDYATGRGIRVVIAPWQAGADGGIAGPTWRGELVGSVDVPVTAFTDFWTKMAGRFKDNARVQFRLITEPHDMSTMQWWTAAQAAVTAIRQAGATQAIYVPGNDYSAASQWTDNWYDTAELQRSNAFGWLNANGPGRPLSDPINNTFAEVHTYLDPDEGGVSAEITSITAARQHLAVAVDEARAHGYKLFLGEIGMYASRRTDDGHPAVDAWHDFVAYANANTDVLLGWTWWAAGAPGWWDDPDSHGGGHYALTPTNDETYSGDTVNMKMIEGAF